MTNNFDIILDQAFLAYNNDNLERAESLCREVLSAQAGNGDALFLLGLIAYRSCALEPATELLFQAVKLYPDIENYTLTLASVLQAQGRLDEALKYYRKFPLNAKGITQQGFILFNQGDIKKSQQLFQQALTLSPHLPEAELGLVLLKQDMKALKKLAEETNIPDSWYHLACAYRKKRKYNEALKAINRTGLKQIAYLIEKGLIFEGMNELDKALEVYQMASYVDSHNPDVLANQANIFKTRGEIAAAENYYKRALAQDQNHITARHNLADLLYREGRLAESLEQYRTLLSGDPNNASALFNLAVILEKTGEYADAAGLYFKNALSDQPSPDIDWRIANTLAFLAEKNKKLATDFAKGWLNNFPNNPVAQHTYAALTGQKEDNILAYTERLYNSFSDSYDSKMKELDNQTISEIKKLVPKKTYQKALDIGCGTGQWGRAFRSHIKHLIGIDISQGMLNIAHKKRCYDQLIRCDLLKYLSEKKTKFDLITAIEVLNYLPKIDTLISDILEHLTSEGLFVFSIETTPGTQPVLGFHGRYLYPKSDTLDLLKKSGFTILTQKEVFLRREGTGFSKGMVVLAQKSSKD